MVQNTENDVIIMWKSVCNYRINSGNVENVDKITKTFVIY